VRLVAKDRPTFGAVALRCRLRDALRACAIAVTAAAGRDHGEGRNTDNGKGRASPRGTRFMHGMTPFCSSKQQSGEAAGRSRLRDRAHRYRRRGIPRAVVVTFRLAARGSLRWSPRAAQWHIGDAAPRDVSTSRAAAVRFDRYELQRLRPQSEEA